MTVFRFPGPDLDYRPEAVIALIAAGLCGALVMALAMIVYRVVSHL
jgi:hypothetical protein